MESSFDVARRRDADDDGGGGSRRSTALAGVLKRAWLTKHRVERPVVVLALIDNEDLDETSGNQPALESAGETVRRKAIGAGATCMAVVIAHGPGLPGDRGRGESGGDSEGAASGESSHRDGEYGAAELRGVDIQAKTATASWR